MNKTCFLVGLILALFVAPQISAASSGYSDETPIAQTSMANYMQKILNKSGVESVGDLKRMFARDGLPGLIKLAGVGPTTVAEAVSVLGISRTEVNSMLNGKRANRLKVGCSENLEAEEFVVKVDED